MEGANAAIRGSVGARVRGQRRGRSRASGLKLRALVAGLIAGAMVAITTGAYGDPIVPGDTNMVIEQTTDLITTGQTTNASGTVGGFDSFNQEVTAVSSFRGEVPGFQAQGINLGAFRLYPTLAVDASYDDNVYAASSRPQSDFFFTEAPGVQLLTGNEQEFLNIFADAGFDEYTRLTGEDTQDYSVGAIGNYSITHATTVSGQFSFSGLHDPRSEADTSPDQSAPTKYTLLLGNVEAQYKPNRLAITLDGSIDRYSYFDAPLFGGGSIDNHDRDRSLYKGYTEASYDFSPGYSAFLRTTFDADQFAQYFDRTGVHRSSDGYQFDGGMDFLLSNLIQGEVYGGYLRQRYAAPLQSISNFDFGAGLTWYAKEFLTIKLSASRQIDDTTFAHASGGDDRNVTLSAEYGVTYRLKLTASAAYDDTNYIGSLPDRVDRTTSAGFGAKYLISEHVTGVVGYQYSTRASTEGLARYGDNLVTIGVNLQI